MSRISKFLLIILLPVIILIAMTNLVEDTADFIIEGFHFFVIIYTIAVFSGKNRFKYFQYALYAIAVDLFIDLVDEFIVLQVYNTPMDRIEDGIAFLGVAFLIVALKDLVYLDEKLYRDADKDSLTKLNNRRHLETILSQRDLKTIVYIDLDDLKKVNDEFGHSAGDKLLIDFANILRNNLDKRVEKYRLGGDEYLLLFRGLVQDEVTRKLASIVEVAGKMKITFSYGISQMSKDESLGDAIAKADRKMYTMKFRKKYKDKKSS